MSNPAGEEQRRPWSLVQQRRTYGGPRRKNESERLVRAPFRGGPPPPPAAVAAAAASEVLSDRYFSALSFAAAGILDGFRAQRPFPSPPRPHHHHHHSSPSFHCPPPLSSAPSLVSSPSSPASAHRPGSRARLPDRTRAPRPLSAAVCRFESVRVSPSQSESARVAATSSSPTQCPQ